MVVCRLAALHVPGTQITDTIASVRRNRQYIDGEIVEDIDVRVQATRESARRSQSLRVYLSPRPDHWLLQGGTKHHSKPRGRSCARPSTHALCLAQGTGIRARGRPRRNRSTGSQSRYSRRLSWRIYSSCLWYVTFLHLADALCVVMLSVILPSSMNMMHVPAADRADACCLAH